MDESNEPTRSLPRQFPEFSCRDPYYYAISENDDRRNPSRGGVIYREAKKRRGLLPGPQYPWHNSTANRRISSRFFLIDSSMHLSYNVWNEILIPGTVPPVETDYGTDIRELSPLTLSRTLVVSLTLSRTPLTRLEIVGFRRGFFYSTRLCICNCMHGMDF